MKKLILYLPFLLFSSYINASVILNPINNSVVISQISSLHNDAVEISASAEFNSSSSLWEYRYLITELNGSLISGGSGAQLVVKEDFLHEGEHDEVNFLRDSIFQYDGVIEPGGSTFFSMPHNYSWHPISIPANRRFYLALMMYMPLVLNVGNFTLADQTRFIIKRSPVYIYYPCRR